MVWQNQSSEAIYRFSISVIKFQGNSSHTEKSILKYIAAQKIKDTQSNPEYE